MGRVSQFLKINVKNDIRAIDPLHSIAKWIGILPPIDLGNLNGLQVRRCFPISMLTIFLTLRALTTYGKVTDVHKYVGTTTQMTDLAVDLSLASSNVLCFIGMNIGKGKVIQSMLMQLRKLDCEFRFFKGDSKYANSQFFLELVLAHVTYVVAWSINTLLWAYSMGFYVLVHFLLRDIEHYVVLIQFLIMRHYALLIRYRYELLNRILSNLSCGGPSNLVDQVDEIPSGWSIRRVNETFTVLGEAVDNYNRIFGWQYFQMYIHILVNLLLPINLGLVYGGGDKRIDGVDFGFQFILICMMYTILPILLSLGIFSAGGVVAEARKTSTIAYKALQKFPNNEKWKFARSELLELAHRASDECPEFTAAGFFAINYRTLFSLYGSVTSYIIVLMQYNK